MKYRVKEVAADFGMTAKEVSEIVGKYYEKPKSYTQVLTAEELNAVFDHVTKHNQISSLEAVFAVKPKEAPAPKAEAPAAAPAKPQQQNQNHANHQNRPAQPGQFQGRPKTSSKKLPLAQPWYSTL